KPIEGTTCFRIQTGVDATAHSRTVCWKGAGDGRQGRPQRNQVQSGEFDHRGGGGRADQPTVAGGGPGADSRREYRAPTVGPVSSPVSARRAAAGVLAGRGSARRLLGGAGVALMAVPAPDRCGFAG